eukprot:GHVR01166000.1.p1 GENE.GHVR01166000.1~~GHVR01166000.1.p1  ORF type:complete len:120 (-),score=1.06 GHVR01166000.1:34-393(-)
MSVSTYAFPTFPLGILYRLVGVSVTCCHHLCQDPWACDIGEEVVQTIVSPNAFRKKLYISSFVNWSLFSISLKFCNSTSVILSETVVVAVLALLLRFSIISNPHTVLNNSMTFSSFLTV